MPSQKADDGRTQRGKGIFHQKDSDSDSDSHFTVYSIVVSNIIGKPS
ncbi:hypothetical protein OOU_Y34scaffold00608g55 [Pyricularia oryzae Y34]|uniref:Uncharacterized protein n=2 Tax=Pyricularia oryzae TaxID=318829 RepID=A0AA97NVT0_PYRO3|nr:hypothetical protein OOU_Y34scaffold00608g55 [Pyricularia oryzae Y34]